MSIKSWCNYILHFFFSFITLDYTSIVILDKACIGCVVLNKYFYQDIALYKFPTKIGFSKTYSNTPIPSIASNIGRISTTVAARKVDITLLSFADRK